MNQKTRTHKNLASKDNLAPSLDPPQNRIERLVQLARLIFDEAEALVSDQTLVELFGSRMVELGPNISFYEEVERFETGLIRFMLGKTGGNQARAARLLSLKPTTLNAKIKQYRIS